jgi:hypothetical protein
MTRRRQRKPPKRRRGECYINLPFWELESPAFVALSADATRVYLFMRKRLNFDRSNNGHVPFSHRDAAEALHAGGWERGCNALAELQHFRFIKLRNGGVPGPNIRLASEWQLTAFECGGQEASKDFMRWNGMPFQPRRRTRKKQLPIGTAPTPRRDYPDPVLDSEATKPAGSYQPVGTVPTLSADGRRRHPDTITATRSGGPSSAKPRIQPEPQAHKRRPRNSGTAWPAPERINLGLSQPEFARLASIRREYLSTIEQGLRKPGPEIRARIQAALNPTEHCADSRQGELGESPQAPATRRRAHQATPPREPRDGRAVD